ncbi:GvpL/GvpF family gas vesicle protein [Streptomyces sp. NPDC046831]|uniref:GvpL/GvpF family gas vesicle protein n=1 Tax=Streptomyces sp. NPDC046831 TaxID=3154805 RepID=UPI0033EC031E
MNATPAVRPPRGGPDTALPPTLTYAFAVTRTPPPAGVLAATAGHDGGGPLRVLRAGAVWVVVQDVPAPAFDETALAARLNRPDELERCVRAHHRGVGTAARRGAVVPLPMATLYRGDANAVEAVTARETALCALLDRLRDRTEWAVKVHAAEPGTASPDAPGTGHGGEGGGRAYLSRVSARRRTRQEAQERARAEAAAADRELRRYAVAATRHRPQSEQLTGRGTPQLLNAAYLVDEGERAGFIGALDRLTAGRGLAHVRIVASGPWIPYSFARPDEEWNDVGGEVRA